MHTVSHYYLDSRAISFQTEEDLKSGNCPQESSVLAHFSHRGEFMPDYNWEKLGILWSYCPQVSGILSHFYHRWEFMPAYLEGLSNLQTNPFLCVIGHTFVYTFRKGNYVLLTGVTFSLTIVVTRNSAMTDWKWFTNYKTYAVALQRKITSKGRGSGRETSGMVTGNGSCVFITSSAIIPLKAFICDAPTV